jgi:hypothetical protein
MSISIELNDAAYVMFSMFACGAGFGVMFFGLAWIIECVAATIRRMNRGNGNDTD